jgi:hypothetical protein
MTLVLREAARRKDTDRCEPKHDGVRSTQRPNFQ